MLQEHTKTQQQVKDENWQKEKEEIINEANNDYKRIKQKLLDKAQLGEYTITGNNKTISLDYPCSFLFKCVERNHYCNPTGRIGTSSYRTNNKVHYDISKQKQYNLYLSIIRDFASKDNISVTPFFTEKDPVEYKKENKIELPYTYKHEWRTTSHEIKAYLKCSIRY